MMDSEFRVCKGRLAQFKSWNNGAEGWAERWSHYDVANLLRHQKTASLGEYELLTRYLPKNLPVLEAGCGLGQLVMALSARGYLVEGVDYSEHTIRRVKMAFPELNVRVGDVYHLDAANETYGGYISLGVLEHNPNAPLSGLLEARRVLRSEGTAFFSIPYLNLERANRLSKLAHLDDPLDSDHLHFYQFYYSEDEFVSLLREARFQVVEISLLGVYWGLTLDFPLFTFLADHRFFHWRIHQAIRDMCERAPSVASKRWAHMIMYVCKPI